MPAPKPGIVRGVRCRRCGSDAWYPPRAKNRKYECKQCRRERHLRTKYGLTQQEYDRQFERQGGRCAICLEEGSLHVDHHHRTSALRQLLCSNCNRGLGLFRDNSVTLRRAAAYIERHGD